MKRNPIQNIGGVVLTGQLFLKNIAVNFTMIYYIHMIINRYDKYREIRTPTFLMDDDRTR